MRHTRKVSRLTINQKYRAGGEMKAIFKQINAELTSNYICLPFAWGFRQGYLKYWGRPVLTGCVMTWVSMQAHRMRALKDSPKPYVARITTPWLLNLTVR